MALSQLRSKKVPRIISWRDLESLSEEHRLLIFSIEKPLIANQKMRLPNISSQLFPGTEVVSHLSLFNLLIFRKV